MGFFFAYQSGKGYVYIASPERDLKGWQRQRCGNMVKLEPEREAILGMKLVTWALKGGVLIVRM